MSLSEGFCGKRINRIFVSLGTHHQKQYINVQCIFKFPRRAVHAVTDFLVSKNCLDAFLDEMFVHYECGDINIVSASNSVLQKEFLFCGSLTASNSIDVGAKYKLKSW